jgi:SAM-dependent methyltransferase
MAQAMALDGSEVSRKSHGHERPRAVDRDWLFDLLLPARSFAGNGLRGAAYFDAMDKAENPRSEGRTVAQTLMESRAFVLLYESIARPTFVRIFGGPDHGMPSMKGEFRVYEGLLGLKERNGIWLDLSCGTGFSTAQMLRSAPASKHVGLDISAAMLDAAARTLAREEGRANVRLVRGDAYALPFTDNCFDGVNNAGSLHLYPDEVGAYGEVYRVLKPGAAFVASSMLESDRPLGKMFAKWTGVRRTHLSTLRSNLESVGFTQYKLICFGDIFVVSVVK